MVVEEALGAEDTRLPLALDDADECKFELVALLDEDAALSD